MKKIFILLVVFFLVGCSNDEVKYDISFNKNTYKIASPYKKPLVPTFYLSNNLNNFDPVIINDDLMMLSLEHFRVNNSYFENGQILSKTEMLKIIEKLNTNKQIVNSLIEQNYKASNGNLKGVTFGIIINPYLEIKKDNGTYTFSKIEISADEVNKIANEFLTEVRKNDKFKNIKVLVSVFFQSEPGLTDGSYRYLGSSFDDKVKLQELNYKRDSLISDYTKKTDMNTYNLIKKITSDLKEVNKSANIYSEGFYFNDKIFKIDIEINGFFLKSEIIYLADLISQEISRDYHIASDIEIKIKNNKELEAIIIKRSNSLETIVEILRG